MSERDDDRAQIYDDLDSRADRAYDDWRQAQDDEREMMLEEALNECKALGVSVKHLRTLARETGATHWAIVNSLKG
jgi:hypothetical protein